MLRAFVSCGMVALFLHLSPPAARAADAGPAAAAPDSRRDSRNSERIPSGRKDLPLPWRTPSSRSTGPCSP
jgi:hypothetical protein